MHRRRFLILTAAASVLQPARGDEPIAATLHKNPNCGCCDGYARHLESNGFKVEIVETNDLAGVKQQAGVPTELGGCHTMFVADYVFDGLVPADIVLRFLKEKPVARGLALPGMPIGAPGMDGAKSEALTVFQFGNGEPTAYATF